MRTLLLSLILTLSSFTLAQASILEIASQIKQFKFNGEQVNKTVQNYQSIQKEYVALDRSQVNKKELVLLKYRMEAFNKWFSEELIETLKSNNEISIIKKQKLFNNLPFIISDSDAKSLNIKASTDSPRKYLKVKTLQETRWSSFKKWKNKKLATSYTISGESATFHGITFTTGDIIIGDTNTFGYELAGATRDTPQTGNHGAIFVMMHEGDRLIPTVFDMHTGGLRASPLSHYMNKKINTYIEIYRLKKSEKVAKLNWQDEIRAYFLSVLDQQKMFHFDFSVETTNDEEKNLTCTELIHNVLTKNAGISPLQKVTQFKQASFDILSQFGTIGQAYVAPADFVYDSRFKMVGYLDMLEVRRNLLIKLNAKQLEILFDTKTVNVDKAYKEINTTIGLLSKMKRKNSFLGRIMRALTGLKISSFPNGDMGIIGISAFFDKTIKSSILECGSRKKLCGQHFNKELEDLNPATFDVNNFLESNENNEVMGNTMMNVKNIFN
jgi:hypothetical protein